MQRIALALVGALVALTVATPSHATLNACAAGKRLCVSKQTAGLLKCHQLAETKGYDPVTDPTIQVCLQKVATKFDGGADPTKGCFAKLEAKFSDCLTTGDTTAREDTVAAFVADAVTALDPGYPAPVTNACSAKKTTCVSKEATALLTCHSKNEKPPGIAPEKFAACLQQARDKFDGGADPTKGCFATLETKFPGCLTTADTASLETTVDGFVNNVVCRLDAGAGTCPRSKFGDLRICGVSILPHVTSVTVREFLTLAGRRLGGEHDVTPVADLDTIAAELNASFDGVPTTFALQHLSLSGGCQAVPWQTGDLTSYTQGDWDTGVGPGGALINGFTTVYASDFGTLEIGDKPTGSALFFEGPAAVRAYLPATGPPGILTGDLFNPTSSPAGTFGGDLVALKLNVDFSEAGLAYFPRTCTPAGTTACPWSAGDVVTYGPREWPNYPAKLLLLQFFPTLYRATLGTMVVGDPPLVLAFNSPDAVFAYTGTASGPPAALDGALINTTSSSSGIFGSDVTGLKLLVDLYDAGDLIGAAGLKFGDLTLCNLPAAANTYPTYDAGLHALNGTTVRQFLVIVSAALSGEPSAYTPAELDPLLQSLNASFDEGFTTVMSPYLYNGRCPR